MAGVKCEHRVGSKTIVSMRSGRHQWSTIGIRALA